MTSLRIRIRADKPTSVYGSSCISISHDEVKKTYRKTFSYRVVCSLTSIWALVRLDLIPAHPRPPFPHQPLPLPASHPLSSALHHHQPRLSTPLQLPASQSPPPRSRSHAHTEASASAPAADGPNGPGSGAKPRSSTAQLRNRVDHHPPPHAALQHRIMLQREQLNFGSPPRILVSPIRTDDIAAANIKQAGLWTTVGACFAAQAEARIAHARNMKTLTILGLAITTATVQAGVPLDGKTGRLPALGFNSWNVGAPEEVRREEGADAGCRRSAVTSTKRSS